MPAWRVLGGGWTRGLDLSRTLLVSGGLLVPCFFTRTSCRKITHANGYYGAWTGWAVSVSVLPLAVFAESHISRGKESQKKDCVSWNHEHRLEPHLSFREVRESFPRQVDKKSRGPQGERGLEFSRRKKGQTFFPLHSLGLYNNNVSCLKTVSGKKPSG